MKISNIYIEENSNGCIANKSNTYIVKNTNGYIANKPNTYIVNNTSGYIAGNLNEYAAKKSKKLSDCGGFTLVKFLIIAAVIVLLAAIATAVISVQLEKSREATDLANVQSAYDEVAAEAANGNTAVVRRVPLVQQQDDWQTNETIIIGSIRHNDADGDTSNWIGVPKAGGTCEVSYNEDTGIVFNWEGESSSGSDERG